MQALKSLTFIPVPKNQNDPLLGRRGKLIARLKEQKALAENPLYIATEQRWEKTPDGRKELVERKRIVRRWWRQDAAGNMHLTVRYGQKLIEFEKGKSAIAVPTKEKLSEIIDVLIEAVICGEFDQFLSGISKARGVKKKAPQTT
jgi:hypothetical protein